MNREGESEVCQCCGNTTRMWMAPTPLWNYVMRDNTTTEPELWGGIVCMACFIHYAMTMSGLPGEGWTISVDHKRSVAWRLELKPEPKGLILTTPSGRVWDRINWRWVKGEGEREVIADD